MGKFFRILGLLFFCNFASAQNPSGPCLEQRNSDPRVQILDTKIPFDISKAQALEILTNKSKPNPKEKIALSIFASEGEKCFQLGAEWRSQNIPPEINALFNSIQLEATSAYAELYSGNITFGDFGKLRLKLQNEMKTKYEAISRELQARQEETERQRQESERQRKLTEQQAQQQREAMAIQRYAQQQYEQQQAEARRQQGIQQGIQMLRDAQPRPVPMQPFPNSMNCQTRYNNGVAYTNCN